MTIERTSLANEVCTLWCLVVMTCVYSPFSVLVPILELFCGPGNFSSGNHPTRQAAGVVSEANCSAISFDAGVVLFICLVNRDRRERFLRLLYGEAACSEFSGYIWVLCWEFRLHGCPVLKLGDVFSLVAPIIKLGQIVCILSFSQTVAVLGTVLQDVAVIW